MNNLRYIANVKEGRQLSLQGYPLSRLLDVDCIARDVRGVVTGVADVRVTHMLYADIWPPH